MKRHFNVAAAVAFASEKTERKMWEKFSCINGKVLYVFFCNCRNKNPTLLISAMFVFGAAQAACKQAVVWKKCFYAGSHIMSASARGEKKREAK